MRYISFLGLFLSIVGCNDPIEPKASSIVFQDTFDDSTSMANWHHTTDYRGGGSFQVVNGQFVRTDVGHVFYYNDKFTHGTGIYSFKARGQWVFFWRGTYQDTTSGRALAIANSDGTLYYFECNWYGYVFGYHNNDRPRQESVYVGSLLTDSLNQIQIIDREGVVDILVNDVVKLSFTVSPIFKNVGQIEIGVNHQVDSTIFDDIVVTQ